jgi:hypothetical protein
MAYIDTGVPGASGSDTIGGTVAEAVALSAAQSNAIETDLSPQGNSAGDVIDLPSPYTPA